MTETEARNKIAEVDHRYRLLLHSTDQLDGSDTQLLGQIKAKYFGCESEFDEVRREHPHLSAALEEKYRLACTGHLETKSRWPKRDARIVKPWGVVPTTADLINFAYEEDLDLFGEPNQFPHFPPD